MIVLGMVAYGNGSSISVVAERSDGAAASAVANIPEQVDVTTEDAGSYVVHVNTYGYDFTLNRIDAIYSVRHFTKVEGRGTGEGNMLCNSDWYPPETYSISYTGKESVIDGGYQVDFNLALDHEEVLSEYQYSHHFEFIPRISGIALMNLQVRLVVGEAAWDPPSGTFDENTLAQPGTMSNVENGFGFVGGGYNHRTRIFPSEAVIESSLFFDVIQRPPSTCLDYCECR